MCTVSRATSLRNFWVWLVVVAPFVSVVPGYCSGESRNEAHACGQGTCGQTAMLRGSDGATETSVWDLLSFCTTSEMLSSFGSSFDSSDWGDFGTKETHNHAPRLREYRISMPLSLGEFSRGRDFTVARINEWEGSANAGPGVKVLCAERRNHTERGPGYYTLKTYDVGKKIPYWVRALLPIDFTVVEEAYTFGAFNEVRIRLAMLSRFLLTISSVQLEGSGHENALELSTQALAVRETTDITLRKVISWRPDVGATGGNVAEAEQEGLITTYKAVSVEFPYLGLQERAEQLIHMHQAPLFQRTHERILEWSREWMGLTRQQVDHSVLSIYRRLSPGAAAVVQQQCGGKDIVGNSVRTGSILEASERLRAGAT